MTLQDVNLIIPPMQTPTFVGQSINSSGAVAFVFQAPYAGTITALCYKTGTVTTGATVDVRLETVDATNGQPSGTLWNTTTNGSQVIADTDDDTWFETALTSSASVTAGDYIAVVIANAGSGDMEIDSCSEYIANSYLVWKDATGAGYAVQTRDPVAALKYSDGVYRTAGWHPAIAFATSGTWSSGERGIRFQVPFKARLAGVVHRFDTDTDVTLRLLADATSPAGAALASIVSDKDIERATTSEWTELYFTSPYTLSAATWYRLTGSVGGASTRVTYTDYDSNAVMNAAWHGKNWYWTQDNGASWTDTTTRVPHMSLIFDQIDDGAGGGSGGTTVAQGLHSIEAGIIA